MIGITGTNARPRLPPHLRELMLGTNPLTIGLPTDEEFPFMLDCATSITQRRLNIMPGRQRYTCGNGSGRDGSALTDSNQILKDLVTGKALAPLGGIGSGRIQGYGYATVVEILSAGSRLVTV